MNKIEFPRIGVDGEHYSKNDVETAYIKSVKTKILGNLSGGFNIGMNPRERVVVEILKRYLEFILLATPEQLFSLTLIADKKYPGMFSNGGKATYFGKTILDCFNYKQYRTTHLVEYAKRLNVKCCPYCNQHYTLNVRTGKKSGLALFQFDHFFSKVKYPFLSMSMYNLIPVCPTCNHNKSDQALPLMFNPYYREIADSFRFEVTGSLHKLYWGDLRQDYIKDVVIKPQKGITQKDLDDFDGVLQIKTQYEWHKDVAFEAFYRAYVNDKNLILTYNKLVKGNPDLISRLIHGTYMDQKDIEKRPLAKFYQDIFRQANGGKTQCLKP